MKNKKITRKVNKKQNEQLDIFFQSIDQYFRELEKQREPYKLWWREMYKAYRQQHPDKTFYQKR